MFYLRLNDVIGLFVLFFQRDFAQLCSNYISLAIYSFITDKETTNIACL